MYEGYLRKPHYYETDQMAIVHHSNYIRWFEEARVDLLEALGLPYQKIEEIGIIIPVLEVTCQYKRMVRYGDTLRIQVFIEHYTPTRFQFRYAIYNVETNELVTTGTSSHCFLSQERQRIVSLQKFAPEFHEIFENYYQQTINN